MFSKKKLHKTIRFPKKIHPKNRFPQKTCFHQKNSLLQKEEKNFTKKMFPLR